MSTTLLVVDDDDEIRELLCDYLTDAGYVVLAAADGKQMHEHLARQKVDLVVLDLMLPGEDGLSLCRQLQALPGLAVIMLSAKGSALDRIIGLEVGADDYLAKPFEPRELIARIKAVLRRPHRLEAAVQEPTQVQAHVFAGFRLEHIKRLLTRPDGQTLTLPRSDYRVLRELLEANNRMLERARKADAARAETEAALKTLERERDVAREAEAFWQQFAFDADDLATQRLVAAADAQAAAEREAIRERAQRERIEGALKLFADRADMMPKEGWISDLLGSNRDLPLWWFHAAQVALQRAEPAADYTPPGAERPGERGAR